MKKYVITGGPNSGKTSIVGLLAEVGFSVLHETSRMVIETKKIMPWDNQELFCEEFLKMQLSREAELSGDAAVFLDRSLVDPVAYAELAGCRIRQTVADDIVRARYERTVFFFEMLPSYCTDTQRGESHEQARLVHQKLREVYARLGFAIVEVPLFSLNAVESKKMRLQFILQQVAK